MHISIIPGWRVDAALRESRSKVLFAAVGAAPLERAKEVILSCCTLLINFANAAAVSKLLQQLKRKCLLSCIFTNP